MLKIAALFAAALSLMPAVGFAASAKERSCAQQAEVVRAVQQARLARIPERKVQAHIEASAEWPKKFNAVIPLVTPWVYEMKMKVVKQNDLADAWKQTCIQQ